MAKSKTEKSKSKTAHVDDEEKQMKSRKKTAADDADDADMEIAEADEEATEVDVDADDAEATEVDTDEPEAVAEADEEAADDDAADEEAESEAGEGLPPDEDEEEAEAEGPKAPPAKITKWTAALILLNWLVAPVFLIVAWQDYMVRAQYTYRTTFNYVQIWGLPLKSEENATSVSNETRPMLKLDTDQLTAAFNSRKGVTKSVVKPGSIDFQPFEETVDVRVPFRLRPSDMSGHLLREVFEGQPEKPVATLEEEIDRLKSNVPDEIAKAAGEVAEALKKKSDDEKRDVIRRVLFPICWGWRASDTDIDPQKTYNSRIWYVEKLDDQITKLKDPKKLDEFLDEALQRRMYYDILAPINVYRPGEIQDVNNYKIEKLANREIYPLDKVKEFMQSRLTASIADKYDPDNHLGKHWIDNGGGVTRDAVEKRAKIGFIMFTLAHTSVPVVNRKLYPKGVERAQVICGLFEFTNASLNYPRALGVLEDRMIAAIVADREGVIAKGPAASGGFILAYDKGVDTLVKDAENLDTHTKRLAKLKLDRDDLQKIYAERVAQHNKTLQRLLDARRLTEEEVKKLRAYQDQLQAAYVDLSDAGDRLYELEAETRAIELRYIQEAIRDNKKGKN